MQCCNTLDRSIGNTLPIPETASQRLVLEVEVLGGWGSRGVRNIPPTDPQLGCSVFPCLTQLLNCLIKVLPYVLWLLANIPILLFFQSQLPLILFLAYVHYHSLGFLFHHCFIQYTIAVGPELEEKIRHYKEARYILLVYICSYIAPDFIGSFWCPPQCLRTGFFSRGLFQNDKKEIFQLVHAQAYNVKFSGCLPHTHIYTTQSQDVFFLLQASLQILYFAWAISIFLFLLQHLGVLGGICKSSELWRREECAEDSGNGGVDTGLMSLYITNDIRYTLQQCIHQLLESCRGGCNSEQHAILTACVCM